MDLRNRGDAMRMRYEREKAPRWGGRPGLMNGPGGTMMRKGYASRWARPIPDRPAGAGGLLRTILTTTVAQRC